MGDFVQLVAGPLTTQQPLLEGAVATHQSRLWAPHTPRERAADGAVGSRKPEPGAGTCLLSPGVQWGRLGTLETSRSGLTRSN